MNKKISIIFFFLICFQLTFSFIVPTFGTNECWKDLSTLANYKGHNFSSFDQGLVGKLYGLVADYHVVCDGGGFVLLAHDFPQDYFRGRSLFINRPVLPILVNLVARPLHLISNSYSITFAAAIFVNFLLFFAAALIFYSLVKKYLSEKVALWSGILFILSPIAHSWLVQPETTVFGIFSLMLSIWFLDNYAARPSTEKLVSYSLMIGVLLLGKMTIVISIFILLIAAYHRKLKEGAAFFILHLLPFLAWYLLVTKVWGLAFGVQEVSKFGVGIWLFALIKQPIYQIAGELLNAIPGYFTSLFYAFLGLPLMMSWFGLYKLADKKKYLFYGGFLLSLFAMMFAMHFYLPRHAFLAFAVIYPAAIVGIDAIAALISSERWKKIYYVVIYFLIIAPAFLDIFKLYEYLGVKYS